MFTQAGFTLDGARTLARALITREGRTWRRRALLVRYPHGDLAFVVGDGLNFLERYTLPKSELPQ